MMKKYLAALTLCMAMGFPAACLAGQQTEELAILSGGDRVYREEDTVVVESAVEHATGQQSRGSQEAARADPHSAAQHQCRTRSPADQ